MVFPPQLWPILVVVFIVCLLGFYRYIWFISVGYGLSITAIGAVLLISFFNELDFLKWVVLLLLIIYGLRLGGYLFVREMIQTSYSAKMKGEIKNSKDVPLAVKLGMWISCPLLYLSMTAPVIYRFTNHLPGDSCLLTGIIIMIAGITLETLSDAQKSAAKKKAPRRFVDTGLFRFVRCPNYLGELTLWTGVFLSGITAMKSPGQWIVSCFGYLGIIYIMFSGARRLELRQERTYGSDPEYRAYVKKTPILLPFIPLYSVKYAKWLDG